ncbi:MAG: ATP-dependent RNA helicase, partial [Desulfovermiculus sp.]|nr:ATP-dependent RNA helicase [Desulfovermiculus sp.]
PLLMPTQTPTSNASGFEALKPEFLSALNQGSVVVQAPTGTGKSTRLPIWSLELGSVLVVEPRRIVCRSLARYLASTQGVSLGREIGFATRFETRFQPDTKLVFVTPGIALRWYADKKLSEYSTIILDEFHERRWDMDLLLALLRADDRRMVLTSATFAGRKLAEYIQGTSLTTEDPSYPVRTEYLEDTSLPRSKNLDQRVAKAVDQVLNHTPEGDVLVFLPGRGEIQAAKSLLDRRLPPDRVIGLHASTDSAIQDAVLAPSTKQRVILATNVAETSLTLPSVRAVVDSGLERRTFRRNGLTVLGLSVISQASADQRAGRAGRLGPGLCLRLWGRQAKLESYTPPEILREDLSDLVLMAAACGRRIEELQFPEPLPQAALEQALSRLASMQAVDSSGRITEHGRAFVRLPVDPLPAHLIMAMPDSATQAMMVDLAAALSTQGRILAGLPPAKDQEILKDFAPEECDALTLIRCLRCDPPDKLPVLPGPLREARAISDQLRQLCHLPARSGREKLPRTGFLLAVLKATPELLFVRRPKRPQAMGNETMEIQIGSQSRMPEKQAAALVFDLHSVPGKGTTQTLNVGTCLAPVDMELLSQVRVGTPSSSVPVWDGEKVRLEQTWSVAGRTVHSEQHEPQGQELCRAASRLILEGRILDPAGERITEEVQAWNLAVHVSFYQGEKVDAKQWLTARLQELGLEQSSELSLLEPEDLYFEGIPDWERERFERTYPRRLRLENMDVNVYYYPETQEILLTKTGGVRKNPPTRRELPAWGRKWTVRFRDKSRTVNI